MLHRLGSSFIPQPHPLCCGPLFMERLFSLS
jgi:hypothetical protein